MLRSQRLIMTDRIKRLLHPNTIAVIGGGVWCAEVIVQLEAFGFDGEIWPVHRTASNLAGRAAFARLEDLPAAPDAAFVGINRHASIDAVQCLSAMGAGGVVCFASGFSEVLGKDTSGNDLQSRLVRAASEMPILGPNCYGFINAVDGVALWPDQHGCKKVTSGVAILTQSSNIAINLSNQMRGLPIAYVATCGNMAQLSQAALARAMLDDPRVTAIGLHVEGFSDLRRWEDMACVAHEKGVPVVILKVGASKNAQSATVSHTASLAGSDAGAQALIDRLGFTRVHDLSVFLETLKLLHMAGPLGSGQIASISCSGGEASLMADTALGSGLTFPPLTSDQTRELSEVLGPMVALANPLDYHTYIWRDANKMARAWAVMMTADVAMTFTIVDYPHVNRHDWECATQAAIKAHLETGRPMGLVASLPELMPLDVVEELSSAGVVPFFGLREAVAAAAASMRISAPVRLPVALPGEVRASAVLTEASGKAQLAHYGLDVPVGIVVLEDNSLASAASKLKPPLVLKGLGIAHKSEAGAVRLNLTPELLSAAAKKMPCNTFLVEEMVTGAVAELLVGLTQDPAHGFVLTIAAGGVFTELMEDKVSVLVPADRSVLDLALSRLKVSKVLSGFRGSDPANWEAILDAIEALQSYVLANVDVLVEVEINPLICTKERAVAADVLIRRG